MLNIVGWYFWLKCKIGFCKFCEIVYLLCEFKLDGIWLLFDNLYYFDYIKCE